MLDVCQIRRHATASSAAAMNSFNKFPSIPFVEALLFPTNSVGFAWVVVAVSMIMVVAVTMIVEVFMHIQSDHGTARIPIYKYCFQLSPVLMYSNAKVEASFFAAPLVFPTASATNLSFINT